MLELILLVISIATAITFTVKYVHLKKAVETEFDAYESKLEAEAAQRKEIEAEYQSQIHLLKTGKAQNEARADFVGEDGSSHSLMAEIETLRKAKDEEFKLRLEAEKQVEIALQKTKDIDQKIEDWKVLQDANLKDALQSFTKIGNDLYEKLIAHHKAETSETQNALINSVREILGSNNGNNINYSQPTHFQSPESEEKPEIKNESTTSIAEDETSFDEEILARFHHDNHHYTLEEVLQSAGFEAGKNYYPHDYIPMEVRKSVPCESFVIASEDESLIIDTKSLKFFKELHQAKIDKDPDAISNFKHKIDRYLSYLSNPKYKINIINYFSSHNIVKKNINSTLIMLVPTEEEVSEFLSLGQGYQHFLEDYGIELHSLDSISDLIFDSAI